MSDPLPIEFIHHVSRVTRDLDKSIAFYQDVLGFQPLARPGFNFRGAWLFNYGLQIHLIESKDQDPPNTEIQARVDHIAFRVSDIDAVQKQLDERGIEFVSRHVPDTGVTQVFFIDPDGNHIECGMYPPTVTSRRKRVVP
ncbi:MAG: VOC family protein [Planctomycetales bacterium]|jgi:catechol 2,3-dioxygenase-like lactoylglutathione lyase family enzyme